jgi:ParB-like chromosome segregation protein Spo0J
VSNPKKPTVVLWPLDRVTPYELNSKVHDDKQIEKICQSITEFGWDQPIVVDAAGVVIKGHGRRLAAIKLGFTSVPVVVRDDLTPEQVRAARLADNRVAISDIDSELLQKELASLEFDLSGIFDKKELDFMSADLSEMKLDAFVDDLDAAVDQQALETQEKIKQTDERPVKIQAALGFKDIQGKDERHVARLMAHAEELTGQTGAEAFVEFARRITTTASAREVSHK